MSTTASPPLAIDPAATLPALLLCAHGARGVAGAAARHAGVLRRQGHFPLVAAAALYGEPRLEAVLADLAPGPLTVVPFMMADGFTRTVLERRLGAARPDARLTPSIGTSDAIAEIASMRAVKGLRAHRQAPAAAALLLVGHGTARHPASALTARRHAAAIAATGRFAEVAVAFLDEAPAVADAVASLRAPFIAAVGLLTDAGQHGATDVARLMAETCRPSAYFGPIGPDPAMLPLILEIIGAQ